MKKVEGVGIYQETDPNCKDKAMQKKIVEVEEHSEDWDQTHYRSPCVWIRGSREDGNYKGSIPRTEEVRVFKPMRIEVGTNFRLVGFFIELDCCLKSGWEKEKERERERVLNEVR